MLRLGNCSGTILKRRFSQNLTCHRFSFDDITDRPKIRSPTHDQDDFFELITRERQKTSKGNGGIKDIKKLVRDKKQSEKRFEMNVSGIDITKSNKELISFIQKKSNEINKKRYHDSNTKWLSQINKNKLKEITQFFKLLPSNNRVVNGKSISDPISIGDLVTLSPESLRMYLIVETPKSFKSNICTLLSDRGEILFIPFQQIIHRFPKIVPKDHHSILRKLVQLEQKHLDVQPAGVPNLLFSKSNETLPKEIRSKKSDPVGDITNESEETAYEPNNFIVAQASSQLLTNSNVETFLVPISARKIYVDSLVQLSKSATDEVGQMKHKLEKLHRRLQYDDNGNLNTPRTISVFEILKKLNTNTETNQPNSGLSIIPGNSINYDKDNYTVSQTLALLTCLRLQPKLWTIQNNKNSFTSTRVTIWPLAQKNYESKVVDYLKSESLNGFSKYLAMKSLKIEDLKNDMYSNVINILKNFVSGKYENDDEISTTIVFLLRKVDRHLIELGAKVDDESYKNEFSRGKAYDLLLKLNEEVVVDPSKWSSLAKLPKQDISLTSNLGQSFYDILDESFNNINDEVMHRTKEIELYETDPMHKLRVNMTDVPIYCIDDASAHEIDDGISIQQEIDHYIISIHIAEPSAYIKPNSTISALAFDRSSTQYLPDEVFPMLPKFISDISGLGREKETRTFVIQYKLSKELIDQFIRQKLIDPKYQAKKELIVEIQNQVENTKSIKYATVRNFRQGFTYIKVDQVLNDKTIISNYLNQVKQNEDFNNLIKLHNISELFSQRRDLLESFSNFNVKIKQDQNKFYTNNRIEHEKGSDSITMTVKNSNKKIQISSKNQDSKSTTLVTEQMIMANYLTAKYASENEIKILYRYLDPKLNEELLAEYTQFIEESNSNATPTISHFEIFKFFTRASVTDQPQKHFPMSLSMYTNITSPLRRFIDILNQWKFQDYFLNEQTITDECLSGIASHINGQNTIMKSLEINSRIFWQGYIIRNYMQQYHNGQIQQPIDFRIKLKSLPSTGAFTGVQVERFPFISAQVENNDDLINDIKLGNLKVGQIIDAKKIIVKKIDFIENEIVFSYKTLES